MRRLVSAVALVLIVFGATTIATVAVSEPRVALVIGNSAYSTTPLKNPENDARLIAETLRSLGFQVIERTNVSQKGMRRLFGDFGDALDDAGPDSVGLFYFSGHGVQVRGENFLIPTDAVINRERDVKIEAVSADEILNTLSFADNRLNIVILDACRNNPYAVLFKSLGRGLARMDAPRGTLIAYSTAPGTLAEDGEGLNSPYTSALARAMRSPGVPAEQVFKLVRDAVIDDTKGAQVPWEESSLTGADFYFNPKGATTTTSQAPDPASIAAKVEYETLFWESIKDSDNPAMYDAYLESYPNGAFANIAKLKRDAAGVDIESDTQTALLTPPPEPTPAIDEMDVTFVVLQASNVRAAPTTQSDRLGQLSRDDAVIVTGKLKDENWYRVEYQGQTAYVYGTLIKQIDAGELAAWQSIESSTEQADFKAFLASYPSGNFADRARVKRDLLAPEPQPKPADLDLAFWESIKNSSRTADYQAYLQRFPDGHFAVLARARIKAAEDARRNEANRLEAERKAAEDARQKAAMEEQRKVAAEEAQRQAAEAIETALVVPPSSTVDLITKEEILSDQQVKDVIIKYYNNKKIKLRSASVRYSTKIVSVENIRVSDLSGNTATISLRYRWETDDSSGGDRGYANGVATIEKVGSTYKVLKFETGGTTGTESMDVAVLSPTPVPDASDVGIPDRDAFRRLPVGTRVDYGNWSYTVERVSGFELHNNAGKRGHFTDYAVFLRAPTCTYSDIDDNAKRAIETIWPLVLGKQVRLTLPGGNWANLRVSFEVTRTETLRLQEREFFTYVVESRAYSPWCKMERTLWYAPELGVIVKERNYHSGSETEHPLPMSYEFSGFTLPGGTAGTQ